MAGARARTEIFLIMFGLRDKDTLGWGGNVPLGVGQRPWENKGNVPSVPGFLSRVSDELTVPSYEE